MYIILSKDNESNISNNSNNIIEENVDAKEEIENNEVEDDKEEYTEEKEYIKTINYENEVNGRKQVLSAKYYMTDIYDTDLIEYGYKYSIGVEFVIDDNIVLTDIYPFTDISSKENFLNDFDDYEENLLLTNKTIRGIDDKDYVIYSITNMGAANVNSFYILNNKYKVLHKYSECGLFYLDDNYEEKYGDNGFMNFDEKSLTYLSDYNEEKYATEKIIVIDNDKISIKDGNRISVNISGQC